MLTRGYIIGKIVDDLAGLKYQLETRNKLGLFDLAKICEDFIKDALNIVLDADFKNLNEERDNNPGIDLGDDYKKLAIQVTSSCDSDKVNNTLTGITEDQKNLYKKVVVLVIGKKQGSYTAIKKELVDEFKFNPKRDIWDLDTLLKKIVVLEMDELNSILNLFQRDLRRVKIELQPVDSNGDFSGSIYSAAEKQPNSPPLNGGKMSDYFDDDFTFDSILDLYRRLSKISKYTREFIPLIVERGRETRGGNSHYRILPRTLEHQTHLSKEDVYAEMEILRDADIISVEEDHVDYESEKLTHYLSLQADDIKFLIQFVVEEKINIRKFFNNMDWTSIDND